jgi:hypothetical protein
MRKAPATLLSLALLACAPLPAPRQAEAAPIEAAPVVAAPEKAGPVEDAAEVAGAWDVVSFDGYQPRRLSGTIRAAYADFGAEGVGLRIECNYSGRSGTIANGRFNSTKGDGAQTVMGCGPEGNARESRYFGFFEKSPTVEHVAPNRLRLRAAGSELILERPAVRRLSFLPKAAELQGEWRMLEFTRYEPGGRGYSGIGLSETPGRIVLSGDRLFYSRCPQYGLTFRWSDGGQLVKTGGGEAPAAPGDCRELAGPAPSTRLPGAAEVLTLLHSSPAVERTAQGQLLVSNDDFGLLLTKER